MKWHLSSVDPQKLSLTIKGILGTVLIFAGFFGYNNLFDPEELTAGIVAAVQAVSVAISSIIALYGLIRKILVKLRVIKV